MRKTAAVLGTLGVSAIIFSLWNKPQVSRSQKLLVANKSLASAPLVARTAVERKRELASNTPGVKADLGKKDLRFYFSRLSALEICKNGTCPYAKTDLRSYEFERGQDLKATLAEMAELARTERIEQGEIAETARKYLASPDGHVQEGALDLLATQPTSPENRNAVLDHVISGYDPQLIEQGLLELSRYGSRDDAAKISQALGESMMSGAPFVAREISTRIAPFINSGTVEYFKDLASSLPPQSVYRANLEKTLADFAKQNG